MDARRRSRRVHIVGCERSGTTLLLEMMWAGFVFDGRCAREQSLFEPPPGDAALFLSKKPLDILRLERALRGDPVLYVLYAVRDPRAVITSRHAGRPDRYLSDYATWRACERVAHRLADHPRFVRIGYERLVQDPEAVQADIAAALSFLERRASFSRFHESASPTQTGALALGGVRAPEATRIAAWREDLPRVQAELLRNPSMPQDLIEAGYETDRAWLDSLRGVEPRRSPRRGRTPDWLRGIDRALRYRWKTRRYLANRR